MCPCHHGNSCVCQLAEAARAPGGPFDAIVVLVVMFGLIGAGLAAMRWCDKREETDGS